MKKVDRRSFLKRLMPAAAGLVVAPTLGEALYYGAKKYFFMEGRNPLGSYGVVSSVEFRRLQEFLDQSYGQEPSLYGIRFWQVEMDAMMEGFTIKPNVMMFDEGTT